MFILPVLTHHQIPDSPPLLFLPLSFSQRSQHRLQPPQLFIAFNTNISDKLKPITSKGDHLLPIQFLPVLHQHQLSPTIFPDEPGDSTPNESSPQRLELGLGWMVVCASVPLPHWGRAAAFSAVHVPAASCVVAI